MMTQPKTKVKFLIKLAFLAPLFSGLSLMLGCEPASNEISYSVDSKEQLSIEILHNSALLVDEKTMTLNELENLLSDMPESPELVRMEVSPDASFGILTDVQNILRKHKAVKISYSSKKNDEGELLTLPPNSSSSKVSSNGKNQMQILVNTEGLLLMNQEPVGLSKVKEKIKKFIDEKATDPSEALVTIKTVPETPYQQYIELLNEIKSAYSELREDAAQNQFGTAFSNLKDYSSEKETIREIYPMKLTITPPVKD